MNGPASRPAPLEETDLGSEEWVDSVLGMDFEDDEDRICPTCNGSGEGRYSSTCSSCGGSGVERRGGHD